MEDSSFTVLGSKTEIKLKKKDAGIKWGKLEGQDLAVEAMAASSGMCAT